MHDSQVAIPLAIITAERVDNLYGLIDSAYDAPEIHAKFSVRRSAPLRVRIDDRLVAEGDAEAMTAAS